MGIHTILDLRDASPKEIRTQFGVVMERTCNELRGISCLELADIAPEKKLCRLEVLRPGGIYRGSRLHAAPGRYSACAAAHRCHAHDTRNAQLQAAPLHVDRARMDPVTGKLCFGWRTVILAE